MPQPSFNLKQRLAALSIAQSAPSPPSNQNHLRHGNASDPSYQTPTSPNSKRKMFFNPPSWMKRAGLSGNFNGDNQYAYGADERRMVQDVLAKMIFQAGVDYECVRLTL